MTFAPRTDGWLLFMFKSHHCLALAWELLKSWNLYLCVVQLRGPWGCVRLCFVHPFSFSIAVTFLSDYGERKMTVFWGESKGYTTQRWRSSRGCFDAIFCQFWFLQVWPRDFETQLRKDPTELPEPLSHKVLCQPCSSSLGELNY